MEADPEHRQYNPIWARLKQYKRVQIAAPRPLHKRIIKAVQKEKYMDIGYKLLIEPATSYLHHHRTHSVITFYLIVPFEQHLLHSWIRSCDNYIFEFFIR